MQLLAPWQWHAGLIRNRIVMAPMCQYQADEAGHASQWHLLHYGSRAVGGVGTIIVEAVAIEDRGRLSGRCLGIYSSSHVRGLSEIAAVISDYGALAGIQLNHGGRRGVGPDQIAPSPLAAAGQPDLQPQAMSEGQLEANLKQWQDAAARAAEAGFQLLEIHAAHGYLLHSFLSPLSNQRDDTYGGSPANRRRFLLAVVAAVQSVWPRKNLLAVRLSAADYSEGGLNIDDTVDTVQCLKAAGVDWVDISSGGLLPADIDRYPGYQVPLAAAVKRRTGITTVAVGGLGTRDLAEAVIAGGHADFVALGRPLLRDPYWVLRTAEYTSQYPWPESYQRARRTEFGS